MASTTLASTDDHSPPLPASLSTTVASPSSSSNVSLPSLNNLVQFISVKLTEENFLIWKKQLLPVLRSQDLYHFIDPDHTPPLSHILDPTTNLVGPNRLYKQWHLTDQILISWLHATFSDSMLSQTLVFSTVRDLYTYLEASFNSQVNARHHQLRLQLQTIEGNDLSISAYLAQIRTIVYSLAATSNAVTDAEIVVNTLRRLGPNYDTFVTAVVSHLDFWNSKIQHHSMSPKDEA
ncbi:hypothetical protein BVC80_723g1 [Macleaya cordata]|uniref:Retrotransposon Copia-like N-terminal domain-containing protein n=1 Tax=Macleaya cordata TaxID=56857 RepID=A0A200QDQ1_MACCD|nr:hypothetical protein BVC80_723g1 [Macleaya cordata]